MFLDCISGKDRIQQTLIPKSPFKKGTDTLHVSVKVHFSIAMASRDHLREINEDGRIVVLYQNIEFIEISMNKP